MSPQPQYIGGKGIKIPLNGTLMEIWVGNPLERKIVAINTIRAETQLQNGENECHPKNETMSMDVDDLLPEGTVTSTQWELVSLVNFSKDYFSHGNYPFWIEDGCHQSSTISKQDEGFTEALKLKLGTSSVDGSIGMGKGNASFWKLMAEDKKFDHRFSICLSRWWDDIVEGHHREYTRGRGVLAIGEITTNYDQQKSHTFFVKDLMDSSSTEPEYIVGLRKLYLRHDNPNYTLGEEPIIQVSYPHENRIRTTSDPGETNVLKLVLDTTVDGIFLPKSLEIPFEMAWKEISTELNDSDEKRQSGMRTGKAKALEKSMENMPTIVFQFVAADDIFEDSKMGQVPIIGTNSYLSDVSFARDAELDKSHPFDIVVALKPEHYIITNQSALKFEDHTNLIHFVDSSNDELMQGKLGTTFMAERNIIFEPEQQRIGFVKSFETGSFGGCSHQWHSNENTTYPLHELYALLGFLGVFSVAIVSWTLVPGDYNKSERLRLSALSQEVIT